MATPLGRLQTRYRWHKALLVIAHVLRWLAFLLIYAGGAQFCWLLFVGLLLPSYLWFETDAAQKAVRDAEQRLPNLVGLPRTDVVDSECIDLGTGDEAFGVVEPNTYRDAPTFRALVRGNVEAARTAIDELKAKWDYALGISAYVTVVSFVLAISIVLVASIGCYGAR